MPKPKKTEVSTPLKDKLKAAKLPKLKETPVIAPASKPAGKASKPAVKPTPEVPTKIAEPKSSAKVPKIRGRKPVETIHKDTTPVRPAAKATAVAPVAESAPTVPSRARKTAISSPTPVAAPPVAISNEAIAERAYYIAERRRSMGWPGDSESDWIEAEAQLRAEHSNG
jgi:hypothetical protein